MIVQEGKYYKTRDGRKVGPIQAAPYYPDYPWTVNEGALMYTPEGKRINEHPDNDLIAEWTDGPVRTVTRTVTETIIEAGVYGHVHVGHQMKPGIASVYVRDDHMTPDQLRAAAAVLLELAGALPDGE